MKNSRLIEKRGTQLTIELKIDLDPNSMLSSEEQIALALNEAGVLATAEALKQFDTSGEPIEKDGALFSSKGVQKKSTNSRMAPKK